MTPTRRCILGVFAHPDDETSCAGGTFSRYAREGVAVYVVTATRGEQGTLGTNGQRVTRHGLPRVRDAELRAVLRMYGAEPPIFLGYRDQHVQQVDRDALVARITAIMHAITPDVVLTFGPLRALWPSRPPGRAPGNGGGLSPLSPDNRCRASLVL